MTFHFNRGSIRRSIRFVLVAITASLSLASLPNLTHAQSAGTSAAATPPRHEIQADFKGVIGLGLVGAELGAVIPALAGARQPWQYIVFPAVGAVGGGVAGYFLLESGNHAQLAVGSLVIGTILIIPALVFTMAETAYDPQEDSNSSARVQTRTLAKARRTAEAGSGMLRLTDDGLALAAPGIGLLPGPTGHESRVSGMSVSLLSGRF